MSQYRKKPVVIDAVQWFPGTTVAGVVGDKPDIMCGCTLIGGDGSSPHVHTASGRVGVEAGDWICTQMINDRRDVWPCKPDIFAATYESAQSSSEGTKEPTPRTLDTIERQLDAICNADTVSEAVYHANLGLAAIRAASRTTEQSPK